MEVIDPREAAIEALAEALHHKLEHVDPTDGEEWGDLTEHERENYRICVEYLLTMQDEIRAASAARTAHANFQIAREDFYVAVGGNCYCDGACKPSGWCPWLGRKVYLPS